MTESMELTYPSDELDARCFGTVQPTAADHLAYLDACAAMLAEVRERYADAFAAMDPYGLSMDGTLAGTLGEILEFHLPPAPFPTNTDDALGAELENRWYRWLEKYCECVGRVELLRRIASAPGFVPPPQRAGDVVGAPSPDEEPAVEEAHLLTLAPR